MLLGLILELLLLVDCGRLTLFVNNNGALGVVDQVVTDAPEEESNSTKTITSDTLMY